MPTNSLGKFSWDHEVTVSQQAEAKPLLDEISQNGSVVCFQTCEICIYSHRAK